MAALRSSPQRSATTAKRRRVVVPGRARHLVRFFACCALYLATGPAAAEASAPAAAAAPRSIDLSRLTLYEARAAVPFDDGTDATLTLDVDLHRRASKLLRQAMPTSGAVIAIDAHSGKILVWAALNKDGDAQRLLTHGAVPAASLFKIVTTTALLQRTKVTTRDRVCIEGGRSGIEPRHLVPAEGPEAQCGAFGAALGFSRNAVFAQLANRHLERDDLVDIADLFGFNAQVAFDVPALFGTLEVPEPKLAFARTAAGFQNSTLTPLGAALLAHTVANEGWVPRLRIVQAAGAYVAPRRHENLRQVMSRVTAHRVRRMMEVTVHSGTSLDAFTQEDGQSYLGAVRVAGKTGTLQQGDVMTSWFVGFAPSRAPRVVLAVLLNNGKIWHRRANELARDVLRLYFAERGVRGVTPP